MTASPNTPLAGLRILDATTFLSGPYCTLMLAGLGAEVIKVEQPRQGDPARQSPPFAGPRGGSGSPETPEDMSFSILKRCRNKKSITLNLKTEKGKEMFLQLARQVDVVVENFRPGIMDRLGVGYNRLREVNPALIYCTISGFGITGAYAGLPAFDIVVQAMSGLMSINGLPDSPPEKVGMTLGDMAAGLFAAVGILAALQHRHRTGQGQLVECSMLDALMAMILDDAPDFWASQGLPMKVGNRLRRLTPFNSYPTTDGHVVIAGGHDGLWERILQVMGREDLVGDPRYRRQADRTARADEVDAIIAAWTSVHTTQEVVDALVRAEVPVGPVRNVLEALEDRELLQRKAVVPLEHPLVGTLPQFKAMGLPIKFSEAEAGFTRPAPLLGEHNLEVYSRMLGLDEKTLADLAGEGVI